MPSLANRVSIIGAVLLLTVALLGGMTTLTLFRLGETSRQLAEEMLEQQRLLNQFQIAMNDAVIHAAAYARSGQRGSLQDARDALDQARRLLEPLDFITTQTTLDVFAADRQDQRVLLVDDSAFHLDRLTTALSVGDMAAATRALQRLELVTQDTATLARIDTQLLDQRTLLLNDDRRSQFMRGVVGAIGTFTLLSLALIGIFFASRRLVARPLQELETVVRAVGAGQFDRRINRIRGFEIGRLQAGVNTMAANLQQQQAALTERAAQLEQISTQQQQLLETINALGTPLLPLRDDILVLPIVGHIDSVRADQIEHRLLETVYQQRTRVAVIDVTGLASSDADSIARLAKIARAVSLLGASVSFAGISAKLAPQMVEHSDLLAGFTSYQTVGEALTAAEQMYAGGSR